jgi:hypothetical protein
MEVTFPLHADVPAGTSCAISTALTHIQDENFSLIHHLKITGLPYTCTMFKTFREYTFLFVIHQGWKNKENCTTVTTTIQTILYY